MELKIQTHISRGIHTAIKISCASILCAATFLTFVFLIRALIENGVVSGTDGGNLIAYSLELNGQNVKAADSTYAPIIPVLILFLSTLLSPIDAILAMSIISVGVSLFTVFYLVSTIASKTQGIILVFATLTIGLSTEMVAWGGYPQLISNSLTLFSITFISKSLEKFRWSNFLLASFISWIAIGTWIPGLVIWSLSSVGILCLTAWQLRSFLGIKKTLYRFISMYIFIGILCIPFIPFYISSFDIFELKSWNHQQTSLAHFDVITDIVFRSWPKWIVVGFAALFIFSLYRSIKMIDIKNRSTINGLLTVTFISISLFLITNELRSLHLFLIGMWLITGFGTFSLARGLANDWSAHGLFKKIPISTCVGLFILILSTQLLIFYKYTDRAIDYYRIVTPATREAILWLKDNNLDSRTVIETGNKFGFQYIWWIEGLGHTPTFSATDRNFFSFKKEREQTDVANAIIESENPNYISNLSVQHNICFLFVDKATYKKSSFLVEAGFRITYENREIAIFTRDCAKNNIQ